MHFHIYHFIVITLASTQQTLVTINHQMMLIQAELDFENDKLMETNDAQSTYSHNENILLSENEPEIHIFHNCYVHVERLIIQTVYNASTKHLNEAQRGEMFTTANKMLIAIGKHVNMLKERYGRAKKEHLEVFKKLKPYDEKIKMLGVVFELAKCCEPPKHNSMSFLCKLFR